MIWFWGRWCKKKPGGVIHKIVVTLQIDSLECIQKVKELYRELGEGNSQGLRTMINRTSRLGILRIQDKIKVDKGVFDEMKGQKW